MLLDLTDHRVGVHAQWSDYALRCTSADQKLRHGNGNFCQQGYVSVLESLWYNSRYLLTLFGKDFGHHEFDGIITPRTMFIFAETWQMWDFGEINVAPTASHILTVSKFAKQGTLRNGASWWVIITELPVNFVPLNYVSLHEFKNKLEGIRKTRIGFFMD